MIEESTVSTIAKLTTAEELFIMPADGFRYGLIDGELKHMSLGGQWHGKMNYK